MKASRSKLLQLFPPAILLVLFFILHTVNENFGLISIPVILKYLLKYIIIGGLLLFFSALLFRNRDKAYIFSGFLVTIYLFFGAFHDFLNSIGLAVRYSVILSSLLVVVLLIGIILKRSKRNMTWLCSYSSLLCLVLLLIEILTFGYYTVTDQKAKNDFGSPGEGLARSYNPCDSCEKPDIYFIVFDAYSSSACLDREFGYDNSQLDSFLLNKGFYIAKRSTSNYAFTTLSIHSTLNLDYLRKDLHSRKIDGKFIVQSATGVYNSELPRVLEKQGYIIRNYSLFKIKGYPVGDAEIHASFKENIIHLQTLEGRIRRDVWGNLARKFPWRNKGKDISRQQEIVKDHAEKYIFSNLQKTEAEIEKSSGPPKFVYTHVSFPHDPYVLDAEGKFNDFANIYRNNSTSYINQIKHANTMIERLVSKLLADSSRKKIIVLASDHGFREYKSETKIPRIFENLSSIYFPDRNYSTLYDSMSNVNIFRVVLNKYFNQQYPLLKDTSVYICDPGLAFEKKKKKK